ncbi:MAG: tandem-95 repeat protein, partial [bacterium]|nr:tandem-95 repeat protein [bacterium]
TSNVASVTVTLNPQNDAPTSFNDAASVNEGASVVIDMAGDDTDPDNALDLSSIVITSAPSNGSLIDNGDGTLTYTHDGTETVGDSFSYTIDDAAGATSNVASVTVTVSPQNDAPTAVNDSASVNEGASVVIDVSGNDTDPDNALDLSSIVITSSPANGSLIDNGDGTFNYTHDGSETLSDSFSYVINDASGATSNAASVTLTVTPQNDAPLLADQAMAVNENTAIGTLVGTVAASDPDLADSLAFGIVSGNVGGAFAIDPISGDLFVANPAALDFETAPAILLVVEAEDLAGARTTATVTVNVANLNEAIALTGPSGLKVDAGSSVVLSTASGTAISISDPDGATSSMEVTLSATGGRMTLATTAGLTLLSGTGTDDSAMTFRGAAGDVAIALDGLEFDADGAATTARIDVAATDLAPGGTVSSVAVGIDVNTPGGGTLPTPPTNPNPEPPPELVLPPNPTPEPEPPTTVAPPPSPTDSTQPAPQTPADITTFSLATPETEPDRPDFTRRALSVDLADLARPLEVEDIVADEDRERSARTVVDLLRPAFVHADFFQSLDQLRREVLDHADETGETDRSWLVPAIEGIAMAATSGLLAGVLRASSLLAMAVSSVPLWKRTDPLMVLSLSPDERLDLEASLRREDEAERRLDAVLEVSAQPRRAEEDHGDEAETDTE